MGGRFVGSRNWAFQPTDVLLAAAGLTFVLGHYRLQGLTRHLLPTDAREVSGSSAWDWWSLGRAPRLVMHRRSAELVKGGEFVLVGLAVLLAVVVALVGWVTLLQQRTVFGLHQQELGRIVL